MSVLRKLHNKKKKEEKFMSKEKKEIDYLHNLTELQAYEIAYEMWQWLAKHPFDRKHQWPLYDKYSLGHMAGTCPLCQFYHRINGGDCTFCFLYQSADWHISQESANCSPDYEIWNNNPDPTIRAFAATRIYMLLGEKISKLKEVSTSEIKKKKETKSCSCDCENYKPKKDAQTLEKFTAGAKFNLNDDVFFILPGIESWKRYNISKGKICEIYTGINSQFEIERKYAIYSYPEHQTYRDLKESDIFLALPDGMEDLVFSLQKEITRIKKELAPIERKKETLEKYQKAIKKITNAWTVADLKEIDKISQIYLELENLRGDERTLDEFSFHPGDELCFHPGNVVEFKYDTTDGIKFERGEILDRQKIFGNFYYKIEDKNGMIFNVPREKITGIIIIKKRERKK